MGIRRLIPGLIIFILSFLITACSSGQTNNRSCITKTFQGEELLPAGVNRIYIEKITNGQIDSLIPETLTSSLKRRINIEGRLTVVDGRSGSDAILIVKIVKFTSEPFDYDSAGYPGKKRLRLDSVVSLIYTPTSRERIKKSEVYAESTYTLPGPATANDYREISSLTDKLSQKIISVISTGWYKEK